MYLRYGSYNHEFDEASVRISKDVLESDQGERIGHTERWEISGRLKGTSQADMKTKILALESAYGTNLADGQSVVLVHNDNTTESAHKILCDRQGTTPDGVRVQLLEYPTGDGAQYSTFRDYRIIVEAEIILVSGGGGVGDILSFEETIRVIGTGGPRFVIREPRSGFPVKQQVSEATPVRATQQGSISSAVAYQPAPGPFWPIHELEPERTLSQRQTSGPRRYITDYGYEFLSPDPL